MRAARLAFQGKSFCHVGKRKAMGHSTDHRTGDAPVLTAAQSQIRGEFRSKQALDPKDSSVNESIEHATQVAKFLRENVVQGKKMDGEEAKYSKLHRDKPRTTRRAGN